MSLKHVVAALSSCVLLHNMMVVERIHGDDDSIDDATFYDMVMDTKVGGNNQTNDEANQFDTMQEENIAR
jgi:hypothetical protein